MKERVLNMAYETKVLLAQMAEYAIVTRSKLMYKYICKIANVEGPILKPYDEAIAEAESDE